MVKKNSIFSNAIEMPLIMKIQFKKEFKAGRKKNKKHEENIEKGFDTFQIKHNTFAVY